MYIIKNDNYQAIVLLVDKILMRDVLKYILMDSGEPFVMMALEMKRHLSFVVHVVLRWLHLINKHILDRVQIQFGLMIWIAVGMKLNWHNAGTPGLEIITVAIMKMLVFVVL